MEKESFKNRADVSSRTVFMGGIPLVSTEASLKEYLSKYDGVLKIDMPRYADTGVLKGYARAVLATTAGVERVIADHPHTIGGLEVGILKWQDPDSYLKKKNSETKRKVYVRIPPSITEDDLSKYFKSIGEIESLSIKTQPVTNYKRNFCYITFATVESAKLAVTLSPHKVRGRDLFCEPSIRPNTSTRQKNLERRLKMGIFNIPGQRTVDVRNKYCDDKASGDKPYERNRLPEANLKDPRGYIVNFNNPSYKKISFFLDLSAEDESPQAYEDFEQQEFLPEVVNIGAAHMRPTSLRYPKASIASISRNHLLSKNICFNLLAPK